MNPSEYIDLGAEVEVQYDPPTATHPVNESIICLEPDEEIRFLRSLRIQQNERRLNQPPVYRNFIDLEEEVQQQPLEAQPTVHRPLNESVICLDDEEIHLVRVVGNPALPPPFLRRNVIDLTDEEEIRNENTLEPQPGGQAPILNAGTGQAEIHVLEIQSPRQSSNGNVRARPSTPQNAAKRPRLSGAEEKENNDATPMCNICYETVSDLRRENIAFNITVCKHFFCEPCITAWRRQRASCPICRRRLNKNNIKRYKE